MDASLLLNERHTISETAFVELVVWRLPVPLTANCHSFIYRLALVVSGSCVLRYDNESGKGDHKHVGQDEHPCSFTTLKALLDDFWSDVDRWRY